MTLEVMGAHSSVEEIDIGAPSPPPIPEEVLGHSSVMIG